MRWATRLLAVVLWLSAAGALTTCSAGGCRGAGGTDRAPGAAARGGGRPESWAAPVHAPGLRNLHRVSDELYRGAQPTPEGMRELERLGVKTVVNLRMGHSDEALLAGTGLVGVHIPAEPWDMDEDEVLRFLRVVRDPERRPVFVHCHHGADRTGAFVAVYRVVEQGWDNAEAVREMTEGGFDFHAVWTRLPEYVRQVEAEALRRRLGPDSPSSPAAVSGSRE